MRRHETLHGSMFRAFAFVVDKLLYFKIEKE